MMETPQNSPFHRYDVGRHTVEVIRNVPATKTLRYAALLHDIGKPDCKTTDEAGVDHFKGHALRSEEMAQPILRRLKMDNDTIRDVRKIVYWHDYGISGKMTKKSVRRMLSKMGAEYFDSYVAIRRGDMAGQSDHLADWKKQVLEDIIKYHDEIIDEGDALSLKDLAIGGADLMKLGIKPGPEMGRILADLLDKVLEEPSLNTKEELIRLIPQDN